MAGNTDPERCLNCACNLHRGDNGCWRYNSKQNPIKDINGYCIGKTEDKVKFDYLRKKVEDAI